MQPAEKRKKRGYRRMGDALPVDHHPARQRAVCIRRMGAFGHAQERVSRLHGTAGNRRSRMSGADRRRNRGTSRRAARRLYLPTERGQEGEDLLHHARRYRLHSGAAERQPLQQGRVLVEIQARRGGFKAQLPQNVLAVQVVDDFGDTSALLISMERRRRPTANSTTTWTL